VPQTLSFQGYLTNKTTGLPYDGAKDMQFALCDSAAGSCASPLFVETRCGSADGGVSVAKGRYSVEIGSQTAGGIPASVFQNNASVWLELRPALAACASFDPFAPRVRMQASSYAFEALHASTASAADLDFPMDVITALPATANGGVTVSTHMLVSLGRVGIGTTDRTAPLSVYSAQQASDSALMRVSSNNAVVFWNDYVASNYFPGFVWNTENNNPTFPKAGTWGRMRTSDAWLAMSASSNYSVGLTTGNTRPLSFWGGGKVGIGITGAPADALVVNGVAHSTPTISQYTGGGTQDIAPPANLFKILNVNSWNAGPSASYFTLSGSTLTIKEEGLYWIHYRILSQKLTGTTYYCDVRINVNNVYGVAQSRNGDNLMSQTVNTNTAFTLRYLKPGDFIKFEGRTTHATYSCRFWLDGQWGTVAVWKQN